MARPGTRGPISGPFPLRLGPARRALWLSMNAVELRIECDHLIRPPYIWPLLHLPSILVSREKTRPCGVNPANCSMKCLKTGQKKNPSRWAVGTRATGPELIGAYSGHSCTGRLLPVHNCPRPRRFNAAHGWPLRRSRPPLTGRRRR